MLAINLNTNYSLNENLAIYPEVEGRLDLYAKQRKR